MEALNGLALLLGNARAPFELLIMLDQTRDESLQVIKRHYFASNLSHHLRVWQSDVPLWEARGEAWLMRHATATHYFISVQPDHLITEPGWDRALVRPFEQYDDVFAVSARCAHDAPTVGGGKGGGSKVGRCGTMCSSRMRSCRRRRPFTCATRATAGRSRGTRTVRGNSAT